MKTKKISTKAPYTTINNLIKNQEYEVVLCLLKHIHNSRNLNDLLLNDKNDKKNKDRNTRIYKIQNAFNIK